MSKSPSKLVLHEVQVRGELTDDDGTVIQKGPSLFVTTEDLELLDKLSKMPDHRDDPLLGGDAPRGSVRIDTYMRDKKEDDGWDWGESENVVVKSQAGISMYWNAFGDVVIGQSRPGSHASVIVQPEHLGAVIRALQDKKREFERKAAG